MAVTNPQATVSDEKSIELAASTRALVDLMDGAKTDSEALKAELTTHLKNDLLSSMVEEDIIKGTFKIPLKDEEGSPDGIVEVLLSVSTSPLSPDEHVLLKGLTPPTLDALFANKDVITGVEDVREVLESLDKMTTKVLDKLFEVKGGKLTITIKDPKMTGLEVSAQTMPTTTFFGKMEVALGDSANRPDDTAILAEWLADRMKGAVKLGNRA